MKLEIYKDEGYKLMGAAFEVYNDRGCGMGEEIYQECLWTQRSARMETVHFVRVYFRTEISVD